MIVGVFRDVIEVEMGRFLFAVSLSASDLSYRCNVKRPNCKDNVIFSSVYVHVNCAGSVSTSVVLPEYVYYMSSASSNSRVT